MRILSICVLMRNLSIVQIHRMRQNSDTAMTILLLHHGSPYSAVH